MTCPIGIRHSKPAIAGSRNRSRRVFFEEVLRTLVRDVKERVRRWQLCDCQKGGAGVRKTKRGKGTKLMAVADGTGLRPAISVGSAAPHEVTLVEDTLDKRFIKEMPKRLIGDRAYDSDPLDERLQKQGIEMIAPHKSNRNKPAAQDGRPLRRYVRRWKIERLFA